MIPSSRVRAAYRHLVQDRKVSPDRIFMFGHSLGAMQAPILAAEQAQAQKSASRDGAQELRLTITMTSTRSYPSLLAGGDPVDIHDFGEREP